MKTKINMKITNNKSFIIYIFIFLFCIGSLFLVNSIKSLSYSNFGNQYTRFQPNRYEMFKLGPNLNVNRINSIKNANDSINKLNYLLVQYKTRVGTFHQLLFKLTTFINKNKIKLNNDLNDNKEFKSNCDNYSKADLIANINTYINEIIKDAIKNTPSPNAPTNDFSKLVYDFFIEAKKTQNM